MRNIAVVTQGLPVPADTSRQLKEAGYELSHLPEGQASYGCLCDMRPDAIVLDLALDYPANGWTIVERAGLNPDLHALPIIIYCESLQDRAKHHAFLEEHDCLILYKPVAADTLVTLLRRLDDCHNLTAGHPHLDQDLLSFQRFI
jgi:DNA-binding response OmpR family regulator